MKNAKNGRKVTRTNIQNYPKNLKTRNFYLVSGLFVAPTILAYILIIYLCPKHFQMGILHYIGIYIVISCIVIELINRYNQKTSKFGKTSEFGFTRNDKKLFISVIWEECATITNSKNVVVVRSCQVILSVIGFITLCICWPFMLPQRIYRHYHPKPEFVKTPNCYNDYRHTDAEGWIMRNQPVVQIPAPTQCCYQLDSFEYLFVNRTGNQAIEKHLNDNRAEFEKYLWERDYTCCNLNEFCAKQLAPSNEQLAYYAPHTRLDHLTPCNNLADKLLEKLIGKKNVGKLTTGFLYWSEFYNKYLFFELMPEEKMSYLAQLSLFFSEHNNEHYRVKYRMTRKEDLPLEEQNDFAMDSDIMNIVDELKEKIAKLQESGVSDFFIRQLVIQETPNAFKVSRLRVTKNYEVILTDYDDMVVEMTPLAKTVFIFFLKHPEGIFFKEISNYKAEINKIYNQITGRTDADKIEKTINDLVDPMKNRLNENCTRIREAFVSKMEENLAQNYYVHGPWREKKKIDLPRHMVTWDEK